MSGVQVMPPNPPVALTGNDQATSSDATLLVEMDVFALARWLERFPCGVGQSFANWVNSGGIAGKLAVGVDGVGPCSSAAGGVAASWAKTGSRLVRPPRASVAPPPMSRRRRVSGWMRAGKSG